jgi:hypothetical protein
MADPGVNYRLRLADDDLEDFDGEGSRTLPLNEPRQEIEFRLPMRTKTAIYRLKYE